MARVRLLLELAQHVHVVVAVDDLAAPQIAQPGLRAGRHHPEGDQRLGLLLGDLERPLHRRPEPVDRVHQMIRTEHVATNRVGVAPGEHGRRPGHGVERVAALGFRPAGSPPTARASSPLTTSRVVRPRAHQDLVVGHQSGDPFVGQSEQALPAEQPQQLLGHPLPRQRPQPLSRSAGHDHDVAHADQGREPTAEPASPATTDRCGDGPPVSRVGSGVLFSEVLSRRVRAGRRSPAAHLVRS